MLLVDNKEFNPSNPTAFTSGNKTHPFLKVWNDAEKVMSEIAKRNRGKIPLVLSGRHVTRARAIDDPARTPYKSNGISLRPSEVYSNGQDEFQVTYYEGSRPEKDGKIKYTPYKVALDDDTKVDFYKDKTKAFFLLFVSPLAVKSDVDEVAELQNTRLIKRGHFKLDDRFKRNAELAKQDKLEGEVIYHIYSVLKDEDVRDLVDAYRVVVPDKEHAPASEMKRALKAKILRRNENNKLDEKLIRDFLSFSKGSKHSTEEVKMKANIEKALDQKILDVKKEVNDDTGKNVNNVYFEDEKLFFVTIGKKTSEKAYNFFSEHEDIYEKVIKKLQ